MNILDEQSSCGGIAVPEHTIYKGVDDNSDKYFLNDVEKFFKGNDSAVMEKCNKMI